MSDICECEPTIVNTVLLFVTVTVVLHTLKINSMVIFSRIKRTPTKKKSIHYRKHEAHYSGSYSITTRVLADGKERINKQRGEQVKQGTVTRQEWVEVCEERVT